MSCLLRCPHFKGVLIRGTLLWIFTPVPTCTEVHEYDVRVVPHMYELHVRVLCAA